MLRGVTLRLDQSNSFVALLLGWDQSNMLRGVTLRLGPEQPASQLTLRLGPEQQLCGITRLSNMLHGVIRRIARALVLLRDDQGSPWASFLGGGEEESPKTPLTLCDVNFRAPGVAIPPGNDSLVLFGKTHFTASIFRMFWQ